MNLEQLIPETATLTKKIKAESGDSEIVLIFRPFNLEDESWLKVTFGDELQKKFETMDMSALSQIAFHQITPESKRELMKVKFMDVDDEGNDVEIAKSGPQKFRQLIAGFPEQFELLQVLLKVRGFSMPIVEELAKHLPNTEAKQEGKS